MRWPEEVVALEVYGHSVKSLAGIERMVNLESLVVSGVGAPDLSSLPTLRRLKGIDLQKLAGPVDYSPLEECRWLEGVSIEFVSDDAARRFAVDLGRWPRLVALYLTNEHPRLASVDVSWVRQAHSLDTLVLRGFVPSDGYTELLAAPWLSRLLVTCDAATFEMLTARLPNTAVQQYDFASYRVEDLLMQQLRRGEMRGDPVPRGRRSEPPVLPAGARRVVRGPRADLRSVRRPDDVEVLEVRGRSVESLAGLERFSRVRGLLVSRMVSPDLRALAELPELRELILVRLAGAVDYAALAACKGLRALAIEVGSVAAARELRLPFAGLPGLERVTLINPASYPDLAEIDVSWVPGADALRELTLDGFIPAGGAEQLLQARQLSRLFVTSEYKPLGEELQAALPDTAVEERNDIADRTEKLVERYLERPDVREAMEDRRTRSPDR